MSDSSKSTHFILLGASGDLAQKKILPTLATQHSLEITLWSRKALILKEKKQYNLIQASYIDKDIWQTLLNKNQNKRLIIYLALPPISYLDILRSLDQCLENLIVGVDVVIEKPFATSSQNMKSIIELINSCSNLKKRVHFFDHFLFKDNLEVAVPQAPKPLLKSVICRLLETIDIKGRVAFYDQTGATQDMISHLMFYAQIFCGEMGYEDKFQWGKYKITRYQVSQYPGYNDNPELLGKLSDTETFFDLELSNPDLNPSKIQLISGKKQPERVWDINVNGVNYDLLPSRKNEHLNMIEALEVLDYSKFVTYNQALEMWELIDRIQGFKLQS